MPELPEVEVLVRALRPVLANKRVRGVIVRREKSVRPGSVRQFKETLAGGTFKRVSRRGKYLLFELWRRGKPEPVIVIGHLGMTGRMYVQDRGTALPRHAAVILNLGRLDFVFEDIRYFGRMSLDASAIAKLGPEPFGADFSLEYFAQALRKSSQAVKIRLLDQHVVAGIGNIYASEALFRAEIAPGMQARRLRPGQVQALRRAIREVLADAIEFGSTVPLSFSRRRRGDKLFYFGSAAGPNEFYEERLQVYDRAGRPCQKCATAIRRVWHAGRSTYYCPSCQKTGSR